MKDDIDTECMNELFDNNSKDENYHWQPVAAEQEEELNETLKKIKEYHDNYVKFWLNGR